MALNGANEKSLLITVIQSDTINYAHCEEFSHGLYIGDDVINGFTKQY